MIFFPVIQRGMTASGTGQMAIGIGRRQFISALGGAAVAWPLAARAQQSAKLPTIAFLVVGSKGAGAPYYSGFPQGMRELGYVEGRDYTFTDRYAEGDEARLPLLAKEL